MWILSAVAAVGLLLFSGKLARQLFRALQPTPPPTPRDAPPWRAPSQRRLANAAALALALLATLLAAATAVLDTQERNYPFLWLFSLPIATALALWAALLAEYGRPGQLPSPWMPTLLSLASLVTLAVGGCYGLLLSYR